GVGRYLLGWIVFKVDGRELSLAFRQYLMLVPKKVARRLEEYAVKDQLACFPCRNLDYVWTERKGVTPTNIAFCLFFRRGYIEFDVGLRKVVQLAAMNMPGEYSRSSEVAFHASIVSASSSNFI